ncbi:hypothetical protein PR202_ga25634 [Eleusine coracana subsp. coracana]|uniref:Uncharacterized protein n=1 Tax=Eleusine coracana subsp. coracana TaxID=191504 RepID=A0AAV5DBH2_ELECO|nr:hypothetical protein PR202_ga25634 [Eleusine coracana subsp. coracana]
MRREVVNFEQSTEESLAQAWSHFQSLLKKGPDLGMDDNLLVQTFYMSLKGLSIMHLDSSARGSFLDVTTKVGMDLLIKIASTKALHRHWDEFEEDSGSLLEQSRVNVPTVAEISVLKVNVKDDPWKNSQETRLESGDVLIGIAHAGRHNRSVYRYYSHANRTDTLGGDSSKTEASI